MPKIEAPDFGGTWEWDGKLTIDTQITLANGKKVSFGNLVTMTNGAALEWFEDQNFKNLEN